MSYRNSGMSTLQKCLLTFVTLVILAGVAFILAGLICASINGTGFAEEITSWFVKTAEEVVEDPETVETTVISVLSMIG